jgi:uncharacterized protein YdhG (YjbR/CyaY superfamily)
MPTNYTTVEAYINSYPAAIKKLLQQMRQLVLSTAPHLHEGISYGMPAYKLNKKPIIYFAAYKHHIGVYALPNAHTAFATALQPYKQGKGSVQFPFSTPLPVNIITAMILHNLAKLQ